MSQQKSYLRRLNSESVVQRIINCLTDAMIAGELKPGDKLPTEPELAATFGVARTSVREATKILSYLGVLESKRSEGTFVSSGFKTSMIDPMVYGIILNQGEDFDNLMELREMAEVGILRLSMYKRSAEGIERIQERLTALEDAIRQKDAEAAFEADNLFHDTVAELSCNPLVMKIDQVVRVLTYAVRRKTVNTMVTSGRGQELLAAHQEICRVLQEQDEQGLNEIIRRTYFLDSLDW